MFIEAEFAFNEGGNDGYWRFQLRSTKTGRWVKMGGLAYFEYRVPGDKTVYRAYGTFQGNIRRGASIIRVGEGESLPPGDYEIDSRFVEPVKAMLKADTPTSKTDVVDAPKKIDEAVAEEAAGKQVVASTVGDLEVGDIVQQNTEAGLYGRIASVDHSGETTKLNVEWSDDTSFDMDLPKDQKIRVWNSQNADVPTTNGGLDWANNDEWYQQALDEYDENRAVMNGDSNAPTNFAPGDNLYSEFEGSTVTTVPSSDPNKKFDVEATKKDGLQIVDFKQRKVVMADINGVQVPFYLSTGAGGKKDVQAGKWYPFFGIEEGTQWINKASGDYINDYYGSPELRAQAEWLDANIGDIRDDNTVPIVRADDVTAFLDKVNVDTHQVRLDKDGLGNDKLDTLIKANIADIVNRVRMDPDALQKKADEAKARVDAVKKQIETVDAPKSDLKPEMDGEDALSIIRDAAAEVAAEDGRFPVARSAEDVEAAAKKQYASVFETLKAENPDLVEQFKDYDEFWAYAKKSMAVSTTTRWADSVDEISELTKAANRIYARDVLGLNPDGLITFYRNAINNHADVATAAAGYASLDRRMAFNYNSNKENNGANGRYSIKAKPDEVRGLLGYSDAVDEHGVVIGPDITSNPDRVERLGDLAWDTLNPLMSPEETQTGSGGGSRFRFFSTASSFDFPVLDANLFAEGEKNNWSDFYAANGLEKGAIPGKYDELYGEGAFERDFPESRGVPEYRIARDMFTEKDGKFSLNPNKFEGAFPGEGGSMVGKAGDKRDKALKFFEAVQGLSGQRIMVPRGSNKTEESNAVLQKIQPESTNGAMTDDQEFELDKLTTSPNLNVAALARAAMKNITTAEAADAEIKRLKEMESQPVPEASEGELDSLFGYRGGQYKNINGYLRGELEVSPEVEKAVSDIDGLIERQTPTDAPVTVYRGLSGAAAERLLAASEGDVFTEAGFSSASSRQQTMWDFAYGNGGTGAELHLTLPDGSRFVEVDRYIPEQVGPIEVSRENETLLPRGLRFRIDSVEGEVVRATVLLDEPETVDAPNEIEEAPAVGKRLTEFDSSAEDEFWHEADTGEEYSASELKSGVAKAVSSKMREMGISDEEFDALNQDRYKELQTSAWGGGMSADDIKVWDGQGRGVVSVSTLINLYRFDADIKDESSSDLISRFSSSGDSNLTVDDVRRMLEEVNRDGYGDTRYRMYPDIPADERAEMAVSAMVQDWATASNDDNHRSLVLQEVVESVFGIVNSSGWDIGPTTKAQMSLYKKKFDKTLEAYVRAQYELTQQRFKDAGISEVVVYRGINGLTDAQVAGLDERSVTYVDVQSRPLSSWSTNSQVAYEFAIGHNGEYSDEKYRNGDEDIGAALLMRQVVPIDRIFSTPFDGVGCYSEREVVLLGGESKVDAVAALGDESMKSVMDSFDTAKEQKRAETRENPGAGGIIGRDELGNPIYEKPTKE